MQTLDEVKDENELKRKRAQKVRVRWLLIGLNALLVSYASYLTVASIVDCVNKSNGLNQGDIITLTNKSEAESLSIYNTYVKGKDDILDVATYGRYLLTSNYRVSPNLVNESKSVKLLNLTDMVNNESTVTNNITLGNKLDEQIDLFSLNGGDYMIASSTTPEGYKALHYTGEEYYQDVLYSFPSEDGLRKKITIKGKNSSPCLLISVSLQEASLPDDYYDLVIIKSNEVNISWFKDTRLKIKEVSSLKEAYKVKASYALNVVEGDSILASNYVSYTGTTTSSLITEGALSTLDSDNAIRELGGHVFNAGYGLPGNDTIAKASQEIYSVKTNSHVGKYTLTVGKDIENPLETIKNIFSF